MPRISVIVPCYNYGRFLRDCLESIFAQTYKDFEVVLTDDGSGDDTADIAGEFPGVRYVYQEHRGISAARNRGLREAKSEWIAFLDADDLWLPEKLEKQTAYLEVHPECNLVFTGFENFYDGDPAQMTEKTARILAANDMPYLPSACVRSELFRAYGGFREDLPYGEDTEWLLRARVCGENMRHRLEETLYRRRVHGGNITLSHDPESLREHMQIAAVSLHGARKFRKTLREKDGQS